MFISAEDRVRANAALGTISPYSNPFYYEARVASAVYRWEIAKPVRLSPPSSSKSKRNTTRSAQVDRNLTVITNKGKIRVSIRCERKPVVTQSDHPSEYGKHEDDHL